MQLRSINTSKFVGHEPCPICHSKDNLARFDDGHGWCFGCGHWEPPTAKVIQFPKQQEQIKTDGGVVEHWPFDAQKGLPLKVQAWLASYDLSYKDINDHNIMWSENKKQLLFPIYDVDGRMIAFQARNWQNGPKWVTRGNKSDILHILPTDQESFPVICIVEDIISAIKLSKYVPVIPIFGTGVSDTMLARITRLTDKLLVWFDPDALDKATMVAKRAQEYGLKAKVLHTPQDPKECSDTTIEKKLFPSLEPI